MGPTEKALGTSGAGPGRAWRPPCAVGPCARGMLEDPGDFLAFGHLWDPFATSNKGTWPNSTAVQEGDFCVQTGDLHELIHLVVSRNSDAL